jgi:hypothetical protein
MALVVFEIAGEAEHLMGFEEREPEVGEAEGLIMLGGA